MNTRKVSGWSALCHLLRPRPLALCLVNMSSLGSFYAFPSIGDLFITSRWGEDVTPSATTLFSLYYLVPIVLSLLLGYSLRHGPCCPGTKAYYYVMTRPFLHRFNFLVTRLKSRLPLWRVYKTSPGSRIMVEGVVAGPVVRPRTKKKKEKGVPSPCTLCTLYYIIHLAYALWTF